MLPQNSSTSSSERFDWRDLFAVGAWFVAFLLLFELVVWILFTHWPLSHSSLRTYLWYGASYESKLRELVHTPNLVSNSILYAGWLEDGHFERMPKDVDVTFYGMSFSGNLAQAMKELRPQETQRLVGGPGAPMGAVYGYYQADHSHRNTRYAVIGATSGAVEEVVLMNRGSLYSDSAFPYFFPRYEIAGNGVKRVADSLVTPPTNFGRRSMTMISGNGSCQSWQPMTPATAASSSLTTSLTTRSSGDWSVVECRRDTPLNSATVYSVPADSK